MLSAPTLLGCPVYPLIGSPIETEFQKTHMEHVTFNWEVNEYSIFFLESCRRSLWMFPGWSLTSSVPKRLRYFHRSRLLFGFHQHLGSFPRTSLRLQLESAVPFKTLSHPSQLMCFSYSDVVGRLWNNPDDFCCCPLSDGLLIHKGVPRHARVPRVDVDVLALFDSWAVYRVSDAPVSLPENVFGLNWWNISPIARWVPMKRLFLHCFFDLEGFRDVSARTSKESQKQSFKSERKSPNRVERQAFLFRGFWKGFFVGKWKRWELPSVSGDFVREAWASEHSRPSFFEN